MTDTPTITLYEKCKHGFLVEHMLAQKGMAQMMWTCPGGRERTFKEEQEPEYIYRDKRWLWSVTTPAEARVFVEVERD